MKIINLSNFESKDHFLVYIVKMVDKKNNNRISTHEANIFTARNSGSRSKEDHIFDDFVTRKIEESIENMGLKWN